MRLIIAEKPSLGRAIAAALDGIPQQQEGRIRVGDTIVSWCFGHLLEDAPPEHYHPKWKTWDLATLPIAIKQADWQLVPKPDARAQLAIIKGLLASASSVVNAGDPDREGQMLVDEVLEHFQWRGPTQRVLIHDTTPQTIRKALAKLKPNAEFAPLFAAAKCRSRADWLVGMNLTRAVSKRIGLTASIGRVQTPTLALIVNRDAEIANHKARVFYTLHAHVSTASDALVMRHDTEHDRIFDKADAKRIADALLNKVVEISVTEKAATENAPLPHTLATFHKEGERRFGWTADQALKILQGLYEKQLVSYPRTDCPYLPEEQASRALPLVKRITKAGHFGAAAPLVALMAPSKRVYDNSKVAEHHGLTPTTRIPGAELDGDARRGWEIVTEQFIKSLLPAYRYLAKEARFTFEGRLFKASGEQPLNTRESWRALEPKKDRDGNPIAPLALSMGNGETAKGRVGQVEIKDGKTTPPKPYTEATLIADMMAVHKFVTDPRIKAVLKENAGIGTAATQAATIEALKRRKLIKSEKARGGKTAYLRSTEFGRYLIANIPPTLTDPSVTALWEEQLNLIAQGKADPGDFMECIERFVHKHVERVCNTTFPPAPAAAVEAAAKKAAPTKSSRARKAPKKTSPSAARA